MLDELVAWGKTCGLRFNSEKSVAIVFTRSRKKPPFALRIDGGEIEFKTEVKYLGVTLDSKLHWTPHINDKISKTKKYLGKIMCMTRNNWGPKPKLKRWAYIGIVRPMLCYGAMIWGHRALELIAKFRRINRMAINTFANFPRSTPTAALEIMLDVLPLHLFCVQEGVAARLRLEETLEFGWHGSSHTKTHAISHMKFLADRLEEFGIRPGLTDRCNSVRWNNAFKIDRDSFSGEAKHRQLTQYNVYTDGSKIDGQTGSGLVVHRGRKEVHCEWLRLPDEATVFQAEIVGIARAAEALAGLPGTEVRYVKILVDSQAAILAIGNHRVKSKVVEWAIDSLNNLAKLAKSVTITWIPAHKGHDGNERADTLAKAGARELESARTVHIGKPGSAVKATLRENIYKTWQHEWSNQPSANHSKSFYSGPNRGKAKFVFKLARLELGRFIRIVTGHNNLSFFQNKIGLSQRRLCRFCTEGDETITHLMAVCPRFKELQKDTFLGQLPKADMTWSVRQLIDFSFSPGINEAFEGTWANDDPVADWGDPAEVTLGLDWLEDGSAGGLE